MAFWHQEDKIQRKLNFLSPLLPSVSSTLPLLGSLPSSPTFHGVGNQTQGLAIARQMVPVCLYVCLCVFLYIYTTSCRQSPLNSFCIPDRPQNSLFGLDTETCGLDPLTPGQHSFSSCALRPSTAEFVQLSPHYAYGSMMLRFGARQTTPSYFSSQTLS